MSEIHVRPYSKDNKEKWDKFVMEESTNGTILQTQYFLDYHQQDRFIDSSIIIYKGNQIIGVMPMNLVKEGKRKVLVSHEGSTFGGIIIGKNNIKVSVVSKIIDEFFDYCRRSCIDEVHLKMTSSLYSKDTSELLDYMLFERGFNCSFEMGYYIDFMKYNKDIISNYSTSVRRHYRASLKNGLIFKELFTRNEIAQFYEVLLDNYKKFNRLPIHSLDELYLLKEYHMKDRVRFFGVFKGSEPVASSMVFDFFHKVFHTQYLASKSIYSRLYVNEYLYTMLIKTAMEEHFQFLSFGTATLDGGKKLNYNLAQYKEQYGTNQYLNKTYHKILND